MKFKYKLTEKILNFINNCDLEEINIGYSDSQIFKIKKENRRKSVLFKNSKKRYTYIRI